MFFSDSDFHVELFTSCLSPLQLVIGSHMDLKASNQMVPSYM